MLASPTALLPASFGSLLASPNFHCTFAPPSAATDGAPAATPAPAALPDAAAAAAADGGGGSNGSLQAAPLPFLFSTPALIPTGLSLGGPGLHGSASVAPPLPALAPGLLVQPSGSLPLAPAPPPGPLPAQQPGFSWVAVQPGAQAPGELPRAGQAASWDETQATGVHPARLTNPPFTSMPATHPRRHAGDGARARGRRPQPPQQGRAQEGRRGALPPQQGQGQSGGSRRSCRCRCRCCGRRRQLQASSGGKGGRCVGARTALQALQVSLPHLALTVRPPSSAAPSTLPPLPGMRRGRWRCCPAAPPSSPSTWPLTRQVSASVAWPGCTVGLVCCKGRVPKGGRGLRPHGWACCASAEHVPSARLPLQAWSAARRWTAAAAWRLTRLRCWRP